MVAQPKPEPTSIAPGDSDPEVSAARSRIRSNPVMDIATFGLTAHVMALREDGRLIVKVENDPDPTHAIPQPGNTKDRALGLVALVENYRKTVKALEDKRRAASAEVLGIMKEWTGHWSQLTEVELTDVGALLGVSWQVDDPNGGDPIRMRPAQNAGKTYIDAAMLLEHGVKPSVIAACTVTGEPGEVWADIRRVKENPRGRPERSK